MLVPVSRPKQFGAKGESVTIRRVLPEEYHSSSSGIHPSGTRVYRSVRVCQAGCQGKPDEDNHVTFNLRDTVRAHDATVAFQLYSAAKFSVSRPSTTRND